jgi:hypothetical protein
MASQQILLSTKCCKISAGANANTNYGNVTPGGVHYNPSSQNYTKRHLVEFDLTQLIPQQASQIVQARLRVSFDGSLNNHSDAAFNIACHRLTAAWVEAQVTWNNRQTGTAWSTPGGDFASPAVVTISSPDNPSGWSTDYFDITQLLKDWLNGMYQNYGVILKCAESVLEWSYYETDDQVTDAYKPALVVDYNPPVVDDISPLATVIRRRRR